MYGSQFQSRHSPQSISGSRSCGALQQTSILAIEQNAWFTDVDLVHSPPDAGISKLVEPPKWLLLIADFCRQRPYVNVRCMPRPFGSYQYPVTFIRKGSYLSRVFRHRDVVSRLMPTYIFDRDLRQDAWVQDPSSVSAVTLPNLRIFPNKDGFDEQVFQKRLNHHPSTSDIEACCRIAKEWFRDGI